MSNKAFTFSDKTLCFTVIFLDGITGSERIQTLSILQECINTCKMKSKYFSEALEFFTYFLLFRFQVYVSYKYCSAFPLLLLNHWHVLINKWVFFLKLRSTIKASNDINRFVLASQCSPVCQQLLTQGLLPLAWPWEPCSEKVDWPWPSPPRPYLSSTSADFFRFPLK